MRTKRQYANLKKLSCTEGFEVKQQDDAVFIEGFANKNTVDRGKDLVATDAWNLDNFMKNPIILFNHGLDPTFGGIPIGKAVGIQQTDEGLRIKVRVSNSKSPLITMVRDLINEKILRAFSVGFETKDDEIVDGVKHIKSAELYEVSVVGIPMNQDSLFELSGKMLKHKSLDQIANAMCSHKGAWVASAVHQTMFERMKEGEFDRDQALEKIAAESEISLDELKDILAGDITPVPEGVLAAFSANLGLDLEVLQKLDEGDVELAKANGLVEEPEEDEVASEEVPEEVPEEEGKIGREEETAEEEEALIPEGEPEDEEEEGKAGRDSNDPEDDNEDDEFDARMKGLQECVRNKIPKFLGEGMEQEQAVAAAFSECQEGEKCNIDSGQLKLALELADSLVSKAADQGSVGTGEAGTGDTVAMQTTSESTDFGNPFLDAQKQTNVLLGSLIAEIQKLSDRMNTIEAQTEELSADPAKAVDSNDSEDDQAEVDPEQEKQMLGDYKKRLESIELRIKNLVR